MDAAAPRSFSEDRSDSELTPKELDLVRRYFDATRFPGCSLSRASPDDDRKGCDSWLTFEGRRYAIDFKLSLRGDPRRFHKDDVVIETVANLESERPGWARDPAKITDFVVWIWRDTGRIFALPFVSLREIVERYHEEWTNTPTYRAHVQTTRESGMQSVALFVPRALLCSLMYESTTTTAPTFGAVSSTKGNV